MHPESRTELKGKTDAERTTGKESIREGIVEDMTEKAKKGWEVDLEGDNE